MKDWIAPQEITFKEKIRLMFKPLKAIKEVTRDYMLVTYYKEMDEKVYVIKEERINY